MAPSIALLFAAFLLQPQGDCQDWQECRQRALDAAGRQEYETFHDLAWRAVQKGPKNDPDLMYLLARAQSLSGRPHDALVMLRRLADMGVGTDATANEDFAYVRALAGWPELEVRLKDSSGEVRLKPGSTGADRLKPDPTDEVRPKPDATPVTVALKAGSAVAPAGLAYDAVSKRFIIGDTVARKLRVIDEFSQRMVTLAGDEATGFGDITAFEIDGRQGDLWVATTGAAADAAATIHKLQLISARLLEAFKLPAGVEAARFSDVSVGADSVVLALDGLGKRIFRIRPRAHALELAARITNPDPASIAAAGAVAYVAHPNGITRVDLASGRASPVAAASIDLRRIARIRAHRGALIGVQQNSDGTAHIIRIRLDRGGRSAAAVDVLAPGVRIVNASLAAVAGDTFYYLSPGEGADAVIRRISLKAF